MTDQEWQAGIERALNAAWINTEDDPSCQTVMAVVSRLVDALPLRIALVHTGKDQLGHFRVGPARDEET